MPAKKMKDLDPIEVKVSGAKPNGNIAHAKVNNGIMGPKISFPHRFSAKIETGIAVDVPAGYRLGFRLVPSLADRGMVATNAPGHFKSGKLSVVLLNCGREIVELKDGDPLAILWIEPDWPVAFVEAE
jgi:dUTPase